MKVQTHFSVLVLLFVCFVANAQNPNAAGKPERSERLRKLVDSAVQKTLEQFADKKLKSDELAVTLVDLSDSQKPLQASYRGEELIYPASVIKLFYLVAAHQWMEEGKLEDTAELRRALRDMIVDSGNEPTHYVVDLLTGTTSGPELSEKDIQEWWNKRNAVNQYFSPLGYTNINVSKKPWCEGPYGREMQAIKLFAPKRNWLSTDATARLLAEVVMDKAVSKKRCEEMKELLKRDWAKRPGGGDDQASGFTALNGLPEGTQLWSKAGWTSETRHDAAYLELPNGGKFVLVTFTVNHANEKQIIPTVVKMITENFSAAK